MSDKPAPSPLAVAFLHSRTGHAPIVGRAQARVATAYKDYQAVTDRIKLGNGNECGPCEISVVICVIYVVFGIILLVGGALVYARPRDLPNITFFALIPVIPILGALWLALHYGNVNARILEHVRAYGVGLDGHDHRESRVSRTLDTPHLAAIRDQAAGKRGWTKSIHERTMGTLYQTLSAEDAFKALSEEDKERALALAAVDVCLYGEQ